VAAISMGIVPFLSAVPGQCLHVLIFGNAARFPFARIDGGEFFERVEEPQELLVAEAKIETKNDKNAPSY
jgi:hypothetical protein